MHQTQIKLYIWLTLADGSIFDCTNQAHADLLFDRGERSIYECFSFIPLSKDNGYTPFLVGSDFLYKTGAISTKFTEKYHNDLVDLLKRVKSFKSA